MVEEVEELAGRVAIVTIAQCLFAIESRQGRTRPEQADQVQAQARAHLAVLLEELHAVDIAAGETQAWIGLELQALVERLIIQLTMFRAGLTQTLDDQEHRLEQRVFAYVAAEPVQSRGCCPMRGVHWYTSPCVLLTSIS